MFEKLIKKKPVNEETEYLFLVNHHEKMICIGRSTIFLALILLASLTVFLLSPIDSDARKLTSSETSAFRRVAKYLVITFLAIDLVLYYLGIFSAAYPIGMGIALTAALQLPCCIRVKS